MDRCARNHHRYCWTRKYGKNNGAVSSFFVSGLLFGPMLSGTLSELFGYWPTWAVAIAVIVVDTLMRVIMVGNQPSKEARGEFPGDNSPRDVESEATGDQRWKQHINERSALLSSPPQGTFDQEIMDKARAYENFYRVILFNTRAVTGLLCNFTTATTLVSFDTTLPLHVKKEFGWGTWRVSLMFFILQIPALEFSSLVCMLKDRVGTRVPTAVGFISCAIFMFLVGAQPRGWPSWSHRLHGSHWWC